MEQTTLKTKQQYFQTKPHVLAAAVALSVLDVAAVALRFWARRRQKQKLKADDWLTLPALVVTLGIVAIMIYGVSQEALAALTKFPDNFMGNPLAVDTEQIRTMNSLQISYAIIFPVALGCAKASFLCLFIRIFSVNKRSGTHVLLVGMLSVVILWTVSLAFGTLFHCKLDFWVFRGTSLDVATHCPGTQELIVAACATDLATDLIVFLIPIPLIWRLNLARSRKIAICVVFLVAGVTIIASTIRLVMMVRVLTVGFDPREDGVLVVTGYLYWGMVECQIAVFVACMPTVQTLFRKWSWKSIATLMKGGSSSPSREIADEASPDARLDATTTDPSEETPVNGSEKGSATSAWKSARKDTVFDANASTGSTLDQLP